MCLPKNVKKRDVKTESDRKAPPARSVSQHQPPVKETREVSAHSPVYLLQNAYPSFEDLTRSKRDMLKEKRQMEKLMISMGATPNTALLNKIVEADGVKKQRSPQRSKIGDIEYSMKGYNKDKGSWSTRKRKEAADKQKKDKEAEANAAKAAVAVPHSSSVTTTSKEKGAAGGGGVGGEQPEDDTKYVKKYSLNKPLKKPGKYTYSGSNSDRNEQEVANKPEDFDFDQPNEKNFMYNLREITYIAHEMIRCVNKIPIEVHSADEQYYHDAYADLNQITDRKMFRCQTLRKNTFLSNAVMLPTDRDKLSWRERNLNTKETMPSERASVNMQLERAKLRWKEHPIMPAEDIMSSLEKEQSLHKRTAAKPLPVNEGPTAHNGPSVVPPSAERPAEVKVSKSSSSGNGNTTPSPGPTVPTAAASNPHPLPVECTQVMKVTFS